MELNTTVITGIILLGIIFLVMVLIWRVSKIEEYLSVLTKWIDYQKNNGK